MVKFAYWGTDEQGAEHRGEVEAAGLVEAADQLRARGVSLSTLERVDAPEEAKPAEEMDGFTFFNRSLAGMTRIGLPLPRAVREISGGLRRGKFKDSLERLERALREGKSLDAAVAEVPGDFPEHYRWMLRAGARSGNLPSVLSAVARNTEGIRRVRRAFAGALAYPALILLFGAVLLVCFLGFFMPMYTQLQEQHAFLHPEQVSTIISVVAGSVALQVGLVGAVAAAVLLLVLWVRCTVPGGRFFFRVPVLGAVGRNLVLARFLGSLGVLLRAKTPLADALPVALGASGSLQFARDAARLQRTAGEGGGVADVLAATVAVPPEVSAYLAVAERTGNLPTATAELADLLTDQALAGSESVYLLLMPSALLVTGILIGTFVVSLMLPYVRFIHEIGA